MGRRYRRRMDGSVCKLIPCVGRRKHWQWCLGRRCEGTMIRFGSFFVGIFVLHCSFWCVLDGERRCCWSDRCRLFRASLGAGIAASLCFTFTIFFCD